MTTAKFEWDDNKDAENQSKHHVSFQEAQAAFADPYRVIGKTCRTVRPKSGSTASAKPGVGF